MNRDKTLFVVVSLAIMSFSASAFALGIRQPEQDTAATGQADAFTAQADDPSAVYYNPAGLTQIEGTAGMAGVYISSPEGSYKGKGPAAGTSKSIQDTINFMPHFYGVTDFGVECFRAGYGIYTPFGQALDWGNNNSFRYVTTKSELQMVNINPTVAFQVGETLSIGIGYDFFYADTDIRRAFPFVIPGPAFVGEGNFRLLNVFSGLGPGYGVCRLRSK